MARTAVSLSPANTPLFLAYLIQRKGVALAKYAYYFSFRRSLWSLYRWYSSLPRRRRLLLLSFVLMAAARRFRMKDWVNTVSGQRPHLVYRNNTFMGNLLKRCPTLWKKYSPPWWGVNGHIQIFAYVLKPQPKFKFEREVVTLSDGGTLALDWGHPKELQRHNVTEASPVMLVLHGITGCSKDMRHTCERAARAGFRPVVMNKRGHGDHPLSSGKLTTFGDSEDMREVVDHIKARYPDPPLVGVGYSAGSALLVSYLGDTGYDSKMVAGVGVSPGYDTKSLFVNEVLHPVYNFIMTQGLKQKVLLKNHKHLKHKIDWRRAVKARSIRQFDDSVYVPCNGYKDLEDYWERNNPIRDMMNIRAPIMCINASDDPICKKEQIIYSVFRKRNNAVLVETPAGSHCAFFHGGWKILSDSYWADDVAVEFLQGVIDKRAEDGTPKGALMANSYLECTPHP